MKNIKFTSVYIFSILILSSCGKKSLPIIDLPEETPIVGIDYPNESIMSFPWSIDIVNNKILTFATRGEHIIKIYDANTGVEIHHIGYFGGGPKEFTQPEYWGKNENNDIFIYDIGLKCLRKYSWEEISNTSDLPEVENIPLKNKDILVLSGKYLDNSSFIALSMAGLTQPIIELDKDLEIKTNMGNIPDRNHRSTNLTSYSGSTSVNDNKFVFTMASLGYIACYEKLINGQIKLLWDRYIEEPKYIKDQLDRVNLKLGFSDVKMTTNYIFCSYFGQKYIRENRRNIKVHNILVFDHDGNLLINLHTNRSASRFTVSDDERTIYAVTEEPEVAIIRFDISDLIN
ncbi:BF3164 family lipoprotein [uncultured Parabacteroides sp.]|uniref:BF3164 family lipoprotein n=1 Tax=uncultured Parabacteroides sp. TaxID=512312 RepID=UPI0025DEE362|nr:BF3164 family lipoprotein [uncultured Parabacteroides sp.]